MTRSPIDLPEAAGLVRALEIPVTGDAFVSAIFHGALQADTRQIHETPNENPRPPTLVIMAHHAPGGHKAAENDIFGDLEHHLAQDGFDTLRFDFRGCGTSPGDIADTTLHSMAADMAAVHRWADAQGYAGVVHIADGLGALPALLNPHAKLRALVLLWPVLRPAACYFADALAALPAAQQDGARWVELEQERIGTALLAELQTLDIVKNIREWRLPILVQHGENDHHIPLAQLDILKKNAVKARRVEITTYEGGSRGLRQLAERRTLFYHTRQFLRRYC